jgi:predicted ATPase
MTALAVGSLRCACRAVEHHPLLVAVTGGPGAGKTAVLEMARRSFCNHVALLPEAASIVFGGGFPRHTSDAGRRAAQRAIFHVEREVERLVAEERRIAVALCDRGSLDGLAYWPGSADDYFRELGTDRAAELARYHAVIHLRTPSAAEGYNHVNALRIESATEAHRIDERILEIWADHPRRHVVECSPSFLDKAVRALELMSLELPACCRVAL